MTGLKCQVRPHHAEKIDYIERCTFDEELAVREFIEGNQFREAKSAILGKGETRDRVNMHALKKSSSIS